MKTVFSLLIVLICPLSASCRLPRLHRPDTTAAVCGDSLPLPWPRAVTFSGYDKTVDSNSETFFATNHLLPDSTLTAIFITLTYTDMQGRMLHKADKKIDVEIPSGETRHITIAAWDKNHVFHYHASPTPTRRQSSPYKVKISATGVCILRKNQ